MTLARAAKAAVLAALCLTPLVATSVAHAAPFSLSHSVNNPTPGHHDQFGRAVDVSGGTAIVGAWGDDGSGTDSGRAYLVDTSTGSVTHTLFNPNPSPTPNDRFGFDVGIDGNRAIVGAHLEDGVTPNQGEAYIFNTTTGALEATLVNPNATGNIGDAFGLSVDISGDLAVVGAQFDDPYGTSSAGRAYLFDVVSGSLLHTFMKPGIPFGGDQFGYDVAIDGNLVAISSKLEDGPGVSNSGRVYVFNATTGEREATIASPSASGKNAYINWSVDIDDGKVLVGTPYDDHGQGDDTGRAYLFDALTGRPLQTFNNPSPNSSDLFGSSVSLSGGFAAIGAGYDDPGGRTNAGSAYVFDTLTGDLLQSIAAPGVTGSQFFSGIAGDGLAIDGETLVVGAYGNDTGASNAGRAYVYNFEAQQSSVPAPGTLALLGLGLIGLGYRRSGS